MEDKFIKKKEEMLPIYVDLIKQRDNAKSDTLRKLLDEEVLQCYKLSISFVEFAQAYCDKAVYDSERGFEINENLLKQINVVMNKEITSLIVKNTIDMKLLEIQFAKIDSLCKDIVLEGCINAFDRDFKNWSSFVKELGLFIVDLTTDTIPVISEIKNLCQKVKDVAELVNEFEDNATDYSSVDKKLYEIEVHILYMKNVRMMIEGFTNMFKEIIKNSDMINDAQKENG